MDNIKYLAMVAYTDKSDIEDDEGMVYLSNFDGSYITRVGMEDSITYLAEREITEELTHGTGYSPKDKKWYGWSHRAIFGFKIGSTCSKGDCHYRARNIAEEMEAAKLFWEDDNHECTSVDMAEDGSIYVSWKYNNRVKNKSLRGTISGCSWDTPTKFGKGEWVAKTMGDAKQMAIDFNAGVS